MPRRFPKNLPVWIPTVEGIQETVSPYRSVGAALLAKYSTGLGWALIHHVADRAAFVHAWHLWSLNRLRRLEASAAASRAVETIREQAGVSGAPRQKPKTTTRGIKASKRTQRS